MYGPLVCAFSETAYIYGANLEAREEFAVPMNSMSDEIDRTQGMVDAVLQEFLRRKKRQLLHVSRRDVPLERVAHLAMHRLPKSLALPVLRAILAADPKEKEIWGQLAECYINVENSAEAEAAIARMEEVSGVTLASLKLRAMLAERRDRWESAVALWQQIDETKRSSTSLRGLARCFENNGDIAGAVASLEALVATGEARPGDHYDLAILRSLLTGEAFRQEHSQDFVTRYPEDNAVAEKHAFLVRHVGFFKPDLGSVEQLPQTHEELLDYTSYLGVRPNVPSLPSPEEVEQALKALVSRPTSVVQLEQCVTLLLAREDVTAARTLVRGIGNGETSGRLKTMESIIEEQQGSLRRAVTLQIEAARLCDRVRTLSRLLSLLLSVKRWSAANRTYDYIKLNYGSTLPGLRIVARTAYDLKHFESAHCYFDQVQAMERVERSLHRQAGALWQIGQSERAWSTLLSVVTRRRELISPDERVRQLGLDWLAETIETFRVRAEAIKSEAAKADLVREIETQFRSPNLLKSSSINTTITSNFLTELTALEARQDLEAAASLIEADLNRVISLTSLPQYCGDLFYRAARVYEGLGQKGKALTYLERAIWHNKADPLLVLQHQRLMKETSGCLTGEASKGPAVLILTWKGNLPMAERFARDIKRRTGLPVFTLYGDPTLEVTKTQARKYGHRLIVPSEDGYEFLAKKLCLAYRYLFTCSQVTAVLKTDDDGFIDDPDVLTAMIRSAGAAEIPYGGRINRYMGAVYHHGHLSADGAAPRLALHAPVEYCSGFCYYLGRKGLEEIYRYSLTHFWIDNPHIMYEDVFFGEILSAAGIEPRYIDVVHKSGLFLEGFEALTLLKTMPQKANAQPQRVPRPECSGPLPNELDAANPPSGAADAPRKASSARR